jgi:hypothetical protein
MAYGFRVSELIFMLVWELKELILEIVYFQAVTQSNFFRIVHPIQIHLSKWIDNLVQKLSRKIQQPQNFPREVFWGDLKKKRD